jgi:hypothetical protein
LRVRDDVAARLARSEILGDLVEGTRVSAVKGRPCYFLKDEEVGVESGARVDDEVIAPSVGARGYGA